MTDSPDLTRRAAIAGSAGMLLVAAHATSAAAQPPPPAAPGMTLAFEAIVDVAPTIDIGAAPLGHRRMVPIVGGSFAGPRLKGIVLSGGADRQLIRADGVRLLDATYELRTDDGAVISVVNKVLIDDRSAGPRYAFSTLDITAPDGPHGWLNARVFVGTLASLKPQRQAVRVTVWAVG